VALLALVVLVALPIAADTDEESQPLVTDRPDFTESALTVPRGRVQLESGATHEETRGGEVDTYGELLVRIGLARRLELRVAANSWLAERPATGSGTDGVEDPALGIKWELARAGDRPSLLSPQASLILATTVPLGARAVSADEPLPSAVLALAWETSGPLGVGSNLGLATDIDGEGRYLTGLASVAVGRDLGGAWAGYLEYYAFLPEGSRPYDDSVDAGLTYLVSDDFQLDVRVGTGLGGDTDVFAGLGLAYRW
jgi:hypothetical protein